MRTSSRFSFLIEANSTWAASIVRNNPRGPSQIERQNLTIRMQNRRMTRLTNAFSKKWANHQASLALHFATYNFVTPHGTLTKKSEDVKTTPAIAAGLADHPWTMEGLLMEMSKSTLD